VELGFAEDATTVTLIGAECPHNVNDHESLSAEGILTTIAGTMAVTGSNDVYYDAQSFVVMDLSTRKPSRTAATRKRTRSAFCRSTRQRRSAASRKRISSGGSGRR
jgi:hypothetical protein